MRTTLMVPRVRPCRVRVLESVLKWRNRVLSWPNLSTKSGRALFLVPTIEPPAMPRTPSSRSCTFRHLKWPLVLKEDIL